MNVVGPKTGVGLMHPVQHLFPKWVSLWKRGGLNLWVFLGDGRYQKIRFVSFGIFATSSDGFSPQIGDNKLKYNPSEDLFGLEADPQPRKLIFTGPKLRSWFGPNGQYVRELPCPSCRGRGYTPCTECGIDRSRLDCSQCNGKPYTALNEDIFARYMDTDMFQTFMKGTKGVRTCRQCSGDRVIWEESIDERPWEKARSRYDKHDLRILSAEPCRDDVI